MGPNPRFQRLGAKSARSVGPVCFTAATRSQQHQPPPVSSPPQATVRPASPSLPAAPCALPTAVGGAPCASRPSPRPRPRRPLLPPQPGWPTWQSWPPFLPVTSAVVPSVAGRRRSRVLLLPSRTVLPAAQLCTRKPMAPSMVHCLTLAERVRLSSLLLAAHPRAPPLPASRPTTAVTQPAGCRRPRTRLRPSWTVLPAAQLCTRSPEIPCIIVHCLTLAERACCPLLWLAAHFHTPSLSGSRPPAAVTWVANCCRLGPPHSPRRNAPLASRPRRSAERARLPCPRQTARPRAPSSHALAERRRRALLVYPHCHHRWLGRLRHLPTASPLPSPNAVESSTAAVRRTARLDSPNGLAWLSGALRVERIVSPQQPCARADCRRRSRRRWTLILNSYPPLAQPAHWRLSATARRAARARSRKRRTPPRPVRCDVAS